MITGDSTIDAALASDLTIDITTTGRRSGQPQRIEIWFLNVDDRVFITGTPGPRDWFANLLASPEFVFHLKEATVADLAAHAVPVHDSETRRHVLAHASAQWYRNQADIETLIASAPLVEVTFTRLSEAE